MPTLEGTRRLKIPPGTQGGQRFRLRERGLPTANGSRGDLYVAAQIKIPKDAEREPRAQTLGAIRRAAFSLTD